MPPVWGSVPGTLSSAAQVPGAHGCPGHGGGAGSWAWGVMALENLLGVGRARAAEVGKCGLPHFHFLCARVQPVLVAGQDSWLVWEQAFGN